MTSPGGGPSTRWPTGTEYAAAVQQPSTSFADPEIVGGRLTLTPLGIPASASGQNAVAFHFESDHGALAVRCLLSPHDDGRIRYRALHDHVETRRLPSVVPARWLDEGIRVHGKWWPVVVMPWAPGDPLHVAVEDRLGDPTRLRRLADRWLDLVETLQASDFAHGDYQHGNVLLSDDDEFQLIDLDGIWVPDMGVGPPNEYGHPNYQHAHRGDTDWGPYVDTFSALVVAVSLMALASEPEVARFMTGENLLFTRDDFAAPRDAEIFRTLARSPDPDVVDIAARLHAFALAGRTPAVTVREALDASFDPTAAARPERPTAVAGLPSVDTGGDAWWNDGASQAPPAPASASPWSREGDAPTVAPQPASPGAPGGGTGPVAPAAAASDASGPAFRPVAPMPTGDPDSATIGGFSVAPPATAAGAQVAAGTGAGTAPPAPNVAHPTVVQRAVDPGAAGPRGAAGPDPAAGGPPHVGARQAVATTPSRRGGESGLGSVTGNPALAGLISGAVAGLSAAIGSGIAQNYVDDVRLHGGIYVGLIAALLAALVHAWPAVNLGNWGLAVGRFTVGLLVGAAAGLGAVFAADAMIKATVSTIDTSNALLVAYVWALTAALVGVAVGILRSPKAAVYAFTGGAVAGFAGGLVHGSTTASFARRTIVVEQWDANLLLISTFVAMLIGLAVSAAIRTARSGSLTVVDGPGQGTVIDFHTAMATIGGSNRDTLVIRGRDLAARTVRMKIAATHADVATDVPVMVDGRPAQGRFAMTNGQVIAVGGVFIRLELRGDGKGGRR